MKSVWNSFKAAFAMFSKIPTPMVDWNKENMKYMMCFFPFVGTAIGILTWLVGYVLGCTDGAVFSCSDPYRDPGFCHRRDPCGRTSGYFRCVKFLAGAYKKAGDSERFACRSICHYHSLRLFYPVAGCLEPATW